MSAEVVSLAEAFPREQQRLRDLVATYRSLPGGVGSFGAAMIEQVLRRADQAAIGGDVLAMLRSFEEMKGCK